MAGASKRDFIPGVPSQMIGRTGLMTVTPSKSRSLAGEMLVEQPVDILCHGALVIAAGRT
jgi:hypothetical protein